MTSKHDRVAEPGELPGGGGADAAVRPGDEGHALLAAHPAIVHDRPLVAASGAGPRQAWAAPAVATACTRSMWKRRISSLSASGSLRVPGSIRPTGSPGSGG